MEHLLEWEDFLNESNLIKLGELTYVGNLSNKNSLKGFGIKELDKKPLEEIFKNDSLVTLGFNNSTGEYVIIPNASNKDFNEVSFKWIDDENTENTEYLKKCKNYQIDNFIKEELPKLKYGVQVYY